MINRKIVSLNLEKYFSSVSEGRKYIGTQESNLVSHLLLLMAKSTEVNHWINFEIPTFVYNATKKYPFKSYDNMDYKEMFPVYLNGESKNKVITEVADKLKDENCPKDLIKFSKPDNYKLIEILDDFTDRLNNIKDTNKRILNSNNDSERSIISNLAMDLRETYKLYNKFDFV